MGHCYELQTSWDFDSKQHGDESDLNEVLVQRLHTTLYMKGMSFANNERAAERNERGRDREKEREREREREGRERERRRREEEQGGRKS